MEGLGHGQTRAPGLRVQLFRDQGRLRELPPREALELVALPVLIHPVVTGPIVVLVAVVLGVVGLLAGVEDQRRPVQRSGVVRVLGLFLVSHGRILLLGSRYPGSNQKGTNKKWVKILKRCS